MRALTAALDLLLPPRCPGCGATVDGDGRFCSTCWQALDFLTGEGCMLCHVPMSGPAGSVCAACMKTPPRHDGVRAAVAYDAVSRRMALRLKHARATGMARPMAAALRRHVEGGGLFVPVPLHRWRLWRRGFNQALLIARYLARETALPVDAHLLRRVRATPSLGILSPQARADAVRGAFRMTRRLSGETVWLVDDVYTSGATANACAATLKRGGAGAVVVLAWARVLRD